MSKQKLSNIPVEQVKEEEKPNPKPKQVRKKNVPVLENVDMKEKMAKLRAMRKK